MVCLIWIWPAREHTSMRAGWIMAQGELDEFEIEKFCKNVGSKGLSGLYSLNPALRMRRQAVRARIG